MIVRRGHGAQAQRSRGSIRFWEQGKWRERSHVGSAIAKNETSLLGPTGGFGAIMKQHGDRLDGAAGT